MSNKFIAVCMTIMMVFALSSITAQQMPSLKKVGNKTQLIVNEKPFLILGGELGNSTATSMENMVDVWQKMKDMHLNTILVPVYWELIEPQEGKFDFSLYEDLILEARKHELKIIPLWFGSWKNSMSSHAPAWVKKNQNRFPRVRDDYGKSQEILSSFSDEVLQAGQWQYKVGTQLDKIEPNIFIQWKSTGLYNAMIHPLFHYPVKGILWYQGESNTGKPEEYFNLMEQLVEDWREGWNQPELPFYYVQLANFMEPKNKPSESNWAALRQQQLDMLKIPNTGMAVTIDVGEWNDIHPLNKKDVGERLAFHALKNQYNKKDITVSGPLVKNYKVKKGKIILEFDYVDNGIKKVDALKHFELAGEDNKFVSVNAVVKGKSIVLQRDKITAPKYVRYGWADNPEGVNFFNHEGLPASPFELKLDF